ncbi:MAG: type II secretion system F family protein [bacterium]|nr:type II secretion system F family protein [bacterium]
MLFLYEAIGKDGKPTSGSIDAVTEDVAISSLQRRGLMVSSVRSAEGGSLLEKNITFFERVKVRDVVLLSRQMATLFEAQVSALRIFRLLGAEADSAMLRRNLMEIGDDLQSGSSISNALAKHPKVFSDFYVNMVRAGEESGKLDETFAFLADHLERTYEVTSKAKNAMIYPAFVIFTFVAVMVLMLTTVIPNLSQILKEAGQEIPIYTRIVIGISDAMVNYGIFLLILFIIGLFVFWRWAKTSGGRMSTARAKISIPYIGNLYRKLYLSRIADNLNTMLGSAIPIVKALEITAAVVGNEVYEKLILESVDQVRSGSSVSDALGRYEEIPGIMRQMIKVGEETGELTSILKTLSRFYRREVSNAVDTLVGLIEPVMVVALGLGVGFLLTSVLLPIYNISSGVT